jgi:tetratricopeptide (TPR) repeat protein
MAGVAHTDDGTKCQIGMALTLLRESRRLVRDPERYELVQAIGVAQATAGDVDGAVETMKSIAMPVQVDVGLRKVATILAGRGDAEGAERIVRMIRDDAKDYASDYAPQEPLAWRDLGNAYARAGKKQLAAIAYAGAVRALAEKGSGPHAAMDLAEVAKAQYRLGDQAAAGRTFEKAVERALAVKDRTLSSIALKEVAKAQARSGDVAAALGTLRRIPDANDIDFATGELAVIQSEGGEIEKSRQTANRITHAGAAAKCWLEIARVQARRKEHSGARESLALAIRCANETNNLEWVIDITRDVASLQAEMGGKKESAATFQKVLRILDKGDAIPNRQHRCVSVAVALGKAGFRELSDDTFKKASKLAGRNELGIRDQELQAIFKSAGIAVIAKAQAEAGLFPEAVQTAKMIGDEFQRELTLSEIGERQAARGDLEGALETAGLISTKAHRDYVHYAVATAELDRGEWRSALERGVGMTDSYWKGLVLYRTGRVQARSDADGAIRWCHELKSAEVRARALLGIAEGILDR